VTSPELGSSRWVATEGLPLPLGPKEIEVDDAYNCALYSKHAEKRVRSAELAGESIRTILTRVSGNNAPVGGLKMITGGRMICGPSARHRRLLQDSRAELPRSGGSAPHPGGSPDHRQRCSGCVPAEAEMKRVCRLNDASDGYFYDAAVSVAPSPADFTVRVMAQRDGVPIPCEDARIL